MLKKKIKKKKTTLSLPRTYVKLWAHTSGMSYRSYIFKLKHSVLDIKLSFNFA